LYAHMNNKIIKKNNAKWTHTKDLQKVNS
jgi:hypothetical protein